MGIEDRDYYREKVKKINSKENYQPTKKPINKNSREKAKIKYYSKQKYFVITIFGIIATAGIMAIITNKTNTYIPILEPKNERKQIVKDWKKTMKCNADGSECKTSYSK
jgi:hypothetical protein